MNALSLLSKIPNLGIHQCLPRPYNWYDSSLFWPRSKPEDHGFLLNANNQLKRGRYITGLSSSKSSKSLSLLLRWTVFWGTILRKDVIKCMNNKNNVHSTCVVSWMSALVQPFTLQRELIITLTCHFYVQIRRKLNFALANGGIRWRIDWNECTKWSFY